MNNRSIRPVVGIDSSLTGLGVVRIEERHPLSSANIGSDSSFGALSERYRHSILSLKPFLHKGDLVLMEDYAFGIHPAKSASKTVLQELGGLIKMMSLSVAGMWPISVSPSTLKKFATGRGVGAKKEDMKLAVYKKWGMEFPTTDECEAFALAQLGLCIQGGAPFCSKPGMIPLEWLGYEIDCRDVILKSLDRENRIEDLGLLQVFAAIQTTKPAKKQKKEPKRRDG